MVVPDPFVQMLVILRDFTITYISVQFFFLKGKTVLIKNSKSRSTLNVKRNTISGCVLLILVYYS